MPDPVKNNRRQFLKKSAVGAAAVGFVPYFSSTSKALTGGMKNDRLQVGCIGMGGMGMGDARGFSGLTDIVAVCDVDSQRAEKAKNDPKVGNGKADVYADYRKILERDDIDIVSIVTPDHWHVKMAIEALEAGKHVFCQKPLTLTVDEGRIIREACEKHSDKVFKVGTQQRSGKRNFLRAVNMVQQGHLGEVTKVTIGIDGSKTGGPFKVVDVPEHLDWNNWLGPAPMVDYRKERCHYTFRWWYEYSGGKFTDWGAHHIDIASWALGINGPGMGPIEIDGSDSQHPVEFKNGMPTSDDSFNTSHDFAIQCRFENGLEMEVNSRDDNGILFEGTKGRIFVNRRKITGTPIEKRWDKDTFNDESISELYKGKPYEGHKENFLRCIAEGGLPVSDVFTHVQAMNTCHLSAIAARLGGKITWDPKNEQIVGNDIAASLLSRTPREGFEIPEVAMAESK